MKNFNGLKTGYIAAGAAAGMGCIIMVAFPAIALSAAQKGVSLWASSVLPALLPFFICANFMTVLGIPALIGHLFDRPFQKLFGAPGISAFVFSISITSGYPMGAKLIGDMGRRGEITGSEAKRMLTFCSTSGPLFMLGAVGAGMLLSPAAGAVIAASHYLGAVENGILFRIAAALTRRKNRNGPMVSSPRFSKSNKQHFNKLPKGSVLELFTDSIISSFKALGVICGYIVLFTLITDFLQFSGLLNLFSSAEGKGLAKGFFEMTIGCSSLALLPQVSMLVKCVLCSAIISWGGLSILAQSMSMLSGLGISPLYYIWTKLTHSLLSALTAFLLCPLFFSMDLAATGTFSEKTIVEGFGSAYAFLFSVKMVIMVIVVFLLFVLIENSLQRGKEKRRRKKELHESIRDHSGV